jgi:hypothetical protein
LDHEVWINLDHDFIVPAACYLLIRPKIDKFKCNASYHNYMPKLICSFSNKTTLLLLIALLSLSSCAVMNNQAITDLQVYTSKPATIIFNRDTLHTYRNKATLSVFRKNKPIEITVAGDSITKKVSVSYVNSTAYYEDAAYTYGIGLFFSKNNPKRYGYPGKIYINPTDTISKYTTYGFPRKKGDFLLHLSLPYVNSFHLAPDGEPATTNTGFIGFAGGIDYFYSDKQFINLSVGTITNFFIPFPAPVHYGRGAERERTFSDYITLSNNHIVNRFSLGYGLSYASNTWNLINLDGLAYFNEKYLETSRGRVPKTITSSAFGLLFSSYCRIGSAFNIGLIYRPSFIQLNTADRNKYEHVISLDLAWKIKLFNTHRSVAK